MIFEAEIARRRLVETKIAALDGIICARLAALILASRPASRSRGEGNCIATASAWLG